MKKEDITKQPEAESMIKDRKEESENVKNKPKYQKSQKFRKSCKILWKELSEKNIWRKRVRKYKKRKYIKQTLEIMTKVKNLKKKVFRYERKSQR